MRPEFDMTIHISTERGEVVVEQQKAGGVTTHKNITPQALCDCFLTSRYDDERRPTGLLPEGCIAVVMEKKSLTVCSPVMAGVSSVVTLQSRT